MARILSIIIECFPHCFSFTMGKGGAGRGNGNLQKKRSGGRVIDYDASQKKNVSEVAAAEDAAVKAEVKAEDAAVNVVALESLRKLPPAHPLLVGFDFDCTLTVRHFYKVFAWCYAKKNAKGHAHFEAFQRHCLDKGFNPFMQSSRSDGDWIVMDAIEDFASVNGNDAFRVIFREIFCGGDSRINEIASNLEKLKLQGAEFAIITAGVSTSVLRALAEVPEWLPYFPSSKIYDTSQCRHLCCPSVSGQKAFILRDLVSYVDSRLVLVDDALSKDPIPSWIEKVTGVESIALLYEGSGIDHENWRSIIDA